MKLKTSKILFSSIALIVLCIAFYQRHVLASMTVNMTGYIEVSPNLYVDNQILAEQRSDVASTVEQARDRVSVKFGALISTPVIIVSSSKDRAKRYGIAAPVPGASHILPWGQYIVVSPEGTNSDVLAHELVHVEIAHRLGYFKRKLTLPLWFDEGMAMQVDYRKKKAWSYIQEGRELPPVSSLEPDRQFYSGDRALHYASAKVEIESWLASNQNKGLYEFLEDMKDGDSFRQLYEIYGE